jgi:hypothetical protein
MPAAEWYHRKVEECVALAKAARLNEERARLYALAEYCIRLATEAARGETARLKELTRKEELTRTLVFARPDYCDNRLRVQQSRGSPKYVSVRASGALSLRRQHIDIRGGQGH